MDDAAFVALVDEIRFGARPAEALLPLIEEQSRVFEGRGTREADRRRGWMLAAFEHAGLPDAARSAVHEALDTARDPYLTAGAARALRGAVAANGADVAHLATAFSNLLERDDAVCFEGFPPDWSTGEPSTALLEILETIRTIGYASGATAAELQRHHDGADGLSSAVRSVLGRVLAELTVSPTAAHRGHPGSAPEPETVQTKSCCRAAPAGAAGRGATGLAHVVIQDHTGVRQPFLDVLNGPTVIAFFYTRCENPYKCSLTVTKMGQLQRALAASGHSGDVGLLLLSYDAAHDTPARLARYGVDRGFAPGAAHRLARVVDGDPDLRAHFDLKVGYAGSIVNGHGLELFLTSRDGSVIEAWRRVLWDIDEVLASALWSARGSALTPPDLPRHLR